MSDQGRISPYNINTISIQYQYNTNTISTQYQYNINTISIQYQYNINTISSTQKIRIKKNIRGLLVDPILNSLN